jgi:RNA polymerase sigma-70 factor (ECF subfamily)
VDTLWLHDRVDRLQAGDRNAADDLLRAVAGQLERLARRMLRDFPAVRASTETNDIIQGALLRLVRALREVRPATTRDFANLAAVQVHRELIDLARQFAARAGTRLHPDPGTAEFGPAPTDSVSDLELWASFHAAVCDLPAEEREVVGLTFYHGLTRRQIALLLGVSERTVYRWWSRACLLLNERLRGQFPAGCPAP